MRSGAEGQLPGFVDICLQFSSTYSCDGHSLRRRLREAGFAGENQVIQSTDWSRNAWDCRLFEFSIEMSTLPNRSRRCPGRFRARAAGPRAGRRVRRRWERVRPTHFASATRSHPDSQIAHATGEGPAQSPAACRSRTACRPSAGGRRPAQCPHHPMIPVQRYRCASFVLPWFPVDKNGTICPQIGGDGMV